MTVNKASGGAEILAELSQILKCDAVKMLHSICQKIWKTQQCHRTGKGQFSFQSQRKGNARRQKTLQIAEKRREANGKGERERYTQLNTEFQL